MQLARNERGNMLVFALLIMMVVLIMGIGLMTITANTLKTTTSEREDQAVYYLAEAGLVQKRVDIYEQVKTIYRELKDEYAIYVEEVKNSEDPKLIAPFNFDQSFMEKVLNISINSDYPIVTTYDDHFGEHTYSEVISGRTVDGSNIEFTITSEGRIGETRKRTVAQSFTISLDDVKKGVTEIEIGGNNPPSKLNACYALLTYGGMGNSGGGNFNGNIYSTEEINITGSPVVNGTIHSTKNINIVGTPSQVKGVYSEQDIKISGGGIIYGDVKATGRVTITNLNELSGSIFAGGNVENVADVGGSIQTSGEVKMTRGKVTGYIKANGKIELQGGTVKKDVFSDNSIHILGWPTIDGELIAKEDIVVTGGTFSGGINAIAKGNIRIENWPAISKTIYAGTLTVTHRNDYTKPNPVSAAEVNSLIQQYEQNINNEIVQNGDNQDDCVNSVPVLDAVDTVFPAIVIKPSNLRAVVLPSNNRDGVEIKVEATDDIRVENVQLINDTWNGLQDLTISLNNRGGVLDVSKMSLQSKSRLTLNLTNNNSVYIKELTTTPGSNLVLDLNGGDHTLYVDSLTIAGNIQLLNEGSLKIIVKDKMDLTNSAINMAGEAGNLSIYYAGSEAFTLAGGSHVKGNLHVKNADVTLTASGHVYGDVFVYGKNKVVVNGGASAAEQLFLAPKSEFTLGGGAVINGNIVAGKFVSSGGFTINAPKGSEGNGSGSGVIYVPISEYGDEDELFQRGPQLET